MSQSTDSTDEQERSEKTSASVLRMSGDAYLQEGPEYDIGHESYEDGVQAIEFRQHVRGPMKNRLTYTLELSIDEAEELVTLLRDEIVRAKRDQLEWQTNPDPETGINGEGDV